MTHWFLSPHPDDAVLSCGGHMATLARQGERVIILTVMAGDPPDGFVPTPFVEELWARWGIGTGSAVTEARRAEDQAAAQRIGAEVVHLGYPEAVYRVDPDTSKALYPDVASIFDTPFAVEQNLVDLLKWAILELVNVTDTLHTPFGVGNHVDHVLTRKAITRTRWFYEEYPYSMAGDDAVKRALAGWGIAPQQLAAVVHPVDAAALDAKIAAIACYQSQISTFWSSIDAMDRSVRDYTEYVGGECEWQIVVSEEKRYHE